MNAPEPVDDEKREAEIRGGDRPEDFIEYIESLRAKGVKLTPTTLPDNPGREVYVVEPPEEDEEEHE